MPPVEANSPDYENPSAAFKKAQREFYDSQAMRVAKIVRDHGLKLEFYYDVEDSGHWWITLDNGFGACTVNENFQDSPRSRDQLVHFLHGMETALGATRV